MPAFVRGDLVNKTDEDLFLEPGESIEVMVEMVGNEVRITGVAGDD